MTSCFLLLLAFVVLVVVLALRSRDAKTLAVGIGGIIIGYFVLHALTWLAVIVVTLVGAAFFVFGWTGSVVAGAAGFVGRNFLILMALVVIGGGLLTWRFRPELFHHLAGHLGALLHRHLKLVFATIAALLAAALLLPQLYRWVLVPMWNFVASFMAPVIEFLKSVLTYIFVALIVLAAVIGGAIALAIIGGLLVLQLQAGWHAGRNLRWLLSAGFAIGSSLALIVTVTIATPTLAATLDLSWANALEYMGLGGQNHLITGSFLSVLPPSVEAFAFQYLTSQAAPAFSALVFLWVLIFAVTSLLIKVTSRKLAHDDSVTPTVAVYEFAIMVLGLFVSLILIFATAMTGDSDA